MIEKPPRFMHFVDWGACVFGFTYRTYDTGYSMSLHVGPLVLAWSR